MPRSAPAVTAVSNARREPIKHVVRRSTRFGDRNRIKKNRDAGVSRREFNHTGNSGLAQPLKGAEDFVQRFLGSIVKSLAHAYNQRGISERYDVHHSFIPSEIEESRSTTEGISARSFDFAALRSGGPCLKITRHDLFCAVRLDLDVNRDRLADSRNRFSRWSKHQIEVAPVDRVGCHGPARLVCFVNRRLQFHMQRDRFRHTMHREIAKNIAALRASPLHAAALKRHIREFFHVEELRAAEVIVPFFDARIDAATSICAVTDEFSECSRSTSILPVKLVNLPRVVPRN